jgi:hypothetical protein
MSFSINTPVSDGVTKQFPVAFTNGIYDRAAVHVYVEDDIDGNGDQLERSFTWINDGIIELDVVAPAGKTVTIRREMNRDAPDVDYVDGAILDEANLDQSMDHLLNLIHEIFDGTGIESINVDLDLNGNKLTNLGEGTDDKDSVTLLQVRTLIANLSQGVVAVQEESQTGADIVDNKTVFQNITFTQNLRNLLVFRNGQKLKANRDYVENSDNSITWLASINASDDLDFLTNISTTNSTTDTAAVTHVTEGTTHRLDEYLAALATTSQNIPVINVKDFGIVEGGIEDNTLAYTTMIAEIPEGSTIIWPKGTYKGSFISNKSFNLVGNGSEFIAGDGQSFTVYMAGSISSAQALSSVPAYGDTSISTTHADGQLLRLYSGMQRPSDSQAVNYEMLRVRSGSTLITPVQSDQLGVAATVEEITPLLKVRVDGFNFIGNDASIGLFIQYADGVNVTNVTKQSGTATCVDIRHSMGVHVDAIKYEYPSATGSGQGYNVAFYNVKDVTVGTVTGYGCRHTYDQDSAYNVTVGHVLEYSPASSVCVLSHNGFAGNVTVDKVTVKDLGETYAINTSAQGYVLATDAIISRDITINEVNVTLVGDNSHASAIVYQQQSCKNFTVQNVTVDFKGTYDETVVTRPVVRIDGKPLGKIVVRDIKAYGCNVGAWNYNIATGTPAPVTGTYSVLFENIQVDYPKYLVGFFTDHVTIRKLAHYTSGSRSPDALIYWHGAADQTLENTLVEVDANNILNNPILVSGQSAYFAIHNVYHSSTSSIPVSTSGTTITQRDLLSSVGRLFLNTTGVSTLSATSAEVIPGHNTVIRLFPRSHDVNIPAGSNLNNGNAMTMLAGNIYEFCINPANSKYSLLGYFAYSL